MLPQLILTLAAGTLATVGALGPDRALVLGVPAGPKLVGKWVGPFDTDGPHGTMTLTIAESGGGWTVENVLGDAPAGPATGVAVDGDTIAWTQSVGETKVSFKGTLAADGAELAGTLAATRDGQPLGGGTFKLARK